MPGMGPSMGPPGVVLYAPGTGPQDGPRHAIRPMFHQHGQSL